MNRVRRALDPKQRSSVHVVNEDELLANVSGDVHILKRLTVIFSQSSENDLDALRSAIDQADLIEIQRLSHKMMGALGDLAAPAALAALVDLRARAVAADVDALSGHYERVRSAVERVHEVLADIVQARSLQEP